MRILFVAPNIPVPGFHGGSTHVTEVVRELRRSHDVLLLARKGSTGFQTIPIGGRLAPGIFRYLLPLTLYPQALRAAKKFSPDIVYDRFSSFGLGVMVAKTLKIPVVSMILDASATLITLKGSDRLITTAPHLLAKQYQGKTIQVHWGANTDLFHPTISGEPMRKKLGINRDTLLIGYTGGFYHWHGLETLVSAAEILLHGGKLQHFYFMLIGEGEMRHKIEHMVSAKGLEQYFHFSGRVAYETVPAYIAASDLCFAVYEPEKHHAMRTNGLIFDPLKVFEYLAMGKATIALDSENMRRLFKHQEDIMLMPPTRPDLLAKTFLELAEKSALRQQLGNAGRRLVESSYSWQAHVQQLETIFAELTARSSSIGRR